MFELLAFSISGSSPTNVVISDASAHQKADYIHRTHQQQFVFFANIAIAKALNALYHFRMLISVSGTWLTSLFLLKHNYLRT